MGPKPERPIQREADKSQRLRFIDEELFWTGEITRRRITDAFGVSEETAKADLRDYRQSRDDDLVPDARDNVYRVDLDFTPLFDSHLQPETWLARQMDSPVPQIPIATVPDIQRRPIDPIILQSIVRTIRDGHEVTVYYRSPKQAQARPYRIVPHALLHDGFRWSVRCHSRRAGANEGYWGEMVVDRIEEIGADAGPAAISTRDDKAWHTKVDLEIAPNPALDEAGQAVIAAQHGMSGGRKYVTVRQCMISYFLKRYQLEEPATFKAPNQAPLVLRHRADIQDLLPPAMRVPPPEGDARVPALLRRLKEKLPDLDEQQILEQALALYLTGHERVQG